MTLTSIPADRVRTALGGQILHEERWNGSHLTIIGSDRSPPELESALAETIVEAPASRDDDDYDYPNLSLTYVGSGPTASKARQWEIFIYAAADEEAMDDASSYAALAEELVESFGKYLFIVFVYENRAEYAID